MMIQKFESKGELYAILVREDFPTDKKYNFFSPGESYLQFGLNRYDSGENIKNHMHLPCKKVVLRTEEIIMIRTGKVRVRIYDEDKNQLGEEIMNAGDTLYCAKGGHGFDILEPTEIFEVKQGPYESQEADKVHF